jgi:hypothetical protein
MLTAALLAVTAVLYIGNGLFTRLSGREVGPVIECPEEVLEVSIHDGTQALLTGVTARDDQDGDLTDRVMVGGVSKLIGGDRAKVTCMVFDSDDNMASLVRQVRYTDYRRPRISLKAPLIFATEKEAKLLAQVEVTDVLDGDLSEKARVSTLWATEEEGVYSATVLVTNSMGDTAMVDVPVLIGRSGGILLHRQVIYLQQGAAFDPKEALVSDATGVQIRSEVDTSIAGCYWVHYSRGDALAILTVVVE